MANRIAKIRTKAPSSETNGPVTNEPMAPTVRVSVPQYDLRAVRVRIVGDTPLIVHAWSTKAIRQIVDKQTGKATGGREKKKPEEDYENSLYRTPDGQYGFPASAFKKAAVAACTSMGKTISKVAANQAFHVIGDIVPIEGKPQPREDMVRVGGGMQKIADVRYRAEFPRWSLVLTIKYNNRVLSADELVNLLNVAGFAVGVGEWRAERGGSFGMFHVEVA